MPNAKITNSTDDKNLFDQSIKDNTRACKNIRLGKLLQFKEMIKQQDVC